MDSFKPSADFVARTMDKVRSYEAGRIAEAQEVMGRPLSRPAFYTLFAGGTVLALLQLARAVWTLVSPAVCM